MLTYRSKGPHTNRKGGKMSRTAIDRNTGLPYSPTSSGDEQMSPVRKPRLTDLAKDEKLRAAGNVERNKKQDKEFRDEAIKGRERQQRKERYKEMAQVASKAAADMSEKMAEDQARFSAEHDAAVSEGGAMMREQMRGTPGKAQDIIKRRRV